MKKITFILLFSVWFTYGQMFVDANAGFPQLSESFSAWGDFDGDGDMDLYFVGKLDANDPDFGGLYENDNGSFTLVQNSGLPQYSLGEADWGDADGDGDMDLLIIGYRETTSSAYGDVYLNNGNGTFSAANSGITGVYMGDAHFVDINNDGNPDIAITGMETTGWTNLTKIYVNDGTANFTEIATTLPSLNIGKMKFADYDNDGYLDFVINGWENTTNTPYTRIWKNNGDETFSENTNVTNLPDLWLGDMEWGDVNGDGNADLFISGTTAADSQMFLYINDGNGNFNQDSSFNFTPVHQSEAEFADYDNDGDLDLFITGRHYSTAGSEFYLSKLYLNTNGVFAEDNTTNFAATIYGNVDVADYDNNGTPDIFISGSKDNGSGTGILYKNTAVGSINDNLADNFEIYPNPAVNFVNIKSNNTKQFFVDITDITGKNIYHGLKQNFVHINLMPFPSGIYFVKISEGKDRFVRKLIVR